MDFIFEQFRTGGDRNLGYLLGDRTAGAGALVDPSFDPRSLVDRAWAQGLDVELILNTHGHEDHTNGNARAKELTGAPVAAHPDSPAGPAVPLEDGITVTVGSIGLNVHHVPGHADDHLAFHVSDYGVALTGDLLFVGKIGGTAGEAAAREEYESLEHLLSVLPDHTTIWPGHDFGCRPSSTVALEKSTNPFLRCKDVDEFLELKRTWASYKEEHGLV